MPDAFSTNPNRPKNLPLPRFNFALLKGAGGGGIQMAFLIKFPSAQPVGQSPVGDYKMIVKLISFWALGIWEQGNRKMSMSWE